MQAFKKFLGISAIIIATVPALRAEDTPEDAQLRDALHNATKETTQENAAPAVTKPEPVNEATPAPTPLPAETLAAKPAPIAVPAPAVETTVAPATNDAELREALRKSLAEPPGAPPVAGPAPQVKAAPAPEPAPVKQTPAAQSPLPPPKSEPVVETPPTAEPLIAQPAPSMKPKETKAKPAKTTTFPMEPPSLPANATKEQRLADLLRKYRSDQITPAEYHKQRAAILAEP